MIRTLRNGKTLPETPEKPAVDAEEIARQERMAMLERYRKGRTSARSKSPAARFPAPTVCAEVPKQQVNKSRNWGYAPQGMAALLVLGTLGWLVPTSFQFHTVAALFCAGVGLIAATVALPTWLLRHLALTGCFLFGLSCSTQFAKSMGMHLAKAERDHANDRNMLNLQFCNLIGSLEIVKCREKDEKLGRLCVDELVRSTCEIAHGSAADAVTRCIVSLDAERIFTGERITTQRNANRAFDLAHCSKVVPLQYTQDGDINEFKRQEERINAMVQAEADKTFTTDKLNTLISVRKNNIFTWVAFMCLPPLVSTTLVFAFEMYLRFLYADAMDIGLPLVNGLVLFGIQTALFAVSHLHFSFSTSESSVKQWIHETNKCLFIFHFGYTALNTLFQIVGAPNPWITTFLLFLGLATLGVFMYFMEKSFDWVNSKRKALFHRGEVLCEQITKSVDALHQSRRVMGHEIPAQLIVHAVYALAVFFFYTSFCTLFQIHGSTIAAQVDKINTHTLQILQTLSWREFFLPTMTKLAQVQ